MNKKILAIWLVFVCNLMLVNVSLAADHQKVRSSANTVLQLEIVNEEPTEQSPGFLSRIRQWLGIRRPVIVRPEVGTIFTVQASAYAPSPYQTNAQPCITAAGTRVRPGVVATNFLPMGTLLDINGDPYIVEDRMNRRYQGHYIDLWFPSTREALEFGRRNIKITVTGYGEPGQPLKEEDKDTEKTVPEKEDAAKENEQSEEEFEEEVPVAEENTWEIVKNWASFVTFTLSQFIGAKAKPDVNRFDVDCFN